MSPTPPALQADSLPLSQQGGPRGDSITKLIFQWSYPRMTGFCSPWILHLLLLNLYFHIEKILKMFIQHFYAANIFMNSWGMPFALLVLR